MVWGHECHQTLYKSADPFGVTRRVVLLLVHCGIREIETSPLSPPGTPGRRMTGREGGGGGVHAQRGFSQATCGTKLCAASDNCQSVWRAGLQEAFRSLPGGLLQSTKHARTNRLAAIYLCGFALLTQTAITMPEIQRSKRQLPIRMEGWPPRGFSEAPWGPFRGHRACSHQHTWRKILVLTCSFWLKPESLCLDFRTASDNCQSTY